MDKNKIKKMIQSTMYLDTKSRHEWLKLVDSATDDELVKINAFFAKAKKAQDLHKFKTIHKFGFGKEYLKKIKEISNKYTKKAIKSSEKTKLKNNENPEEILKKLDSL